MANLEENDNFDQLKNLLEGAEIAVSRDLWPEIESKLNDNTKRPSFFWYSFAGLLLGVSTLFGGYFYFNSNNKNIQLVNLATNIPIKEARAIESNELIRSKGRVGNIANDSESKLIDGVKVHSNKNSSKSSLSSSRLPIENYLSNKNAKTVIKNESKLEVLNQNKTSNGALKTGNVDENKDIKSTRTIETDIEKLRPISEISKYDKRFEKNKNKKSIEFKSINNQLIVKKVEIDNINATIISKNDVKKVSNVVLKKQSEINILNKTLINSSLIEINSLNGNEKLNYLLVKSKPLTNDSLNFKQRDIALINRKTNILAAQKSYDIISSLNSFYNNNYKPEDNLLITNSYKYGIHVNYYFNKNIGIGIGIVQNTINYNSILLEKQAESKRFIVLKEVKHPDLTYTLERKDSSVTKINDVANYKSLQIKTINIPIQFLYKFNLGKRFNIENRLGIVTSFASNQSKNITRPVGFSLQHNLNVMYNVTNRLQLIFGPEYSFYITDLAQTKSGWYPLGVQIGARINLK